MGIKGGENRASIRGYTITYSSITRYYGKVEIKGKTNHYNQLNGKKMIETNLPKTLKP